MFKSHAWQQYDKQMQCYKETSNIPHIMTRGSEKDYIKAAELTKRSAASTGLTVGEAILAFLAFILLVPFPHAI
jgi:hypothetical protein